MDVHTICICNHFWLVGWTPLKNMKVAWDYELPNRWNKMFQSLDGTKCSKPQTHGKIIKNHPNVPVTDRSHPPRNSSQELLPGTRLLLPSHTAATANAKRGQEMKPWFCSHFPSEEIIDVCMCTWKCNIHIHIYIYIYIYIHAIIYIYIYVCNYLFIYLFISLSIYLFIYLFIHLFIYLFHCLIISWCMLSSHIRLDYLTLPYLTFYSGIIYFIISWIISYWILHGTSIYKH